MFGLCNSKSLQQDQYSTSMIWWEHSKNWLWLWFTWMLNVFDVIFNLIFFTPFLWCCWTPNWNVRNLEREEGRDNERETRSMQYNFIWLYFLYYLNWLSTAFSNIHTHAFHLPQYYRVVGWSVDQVVELLLTIRTNTYYIEKNIH